MNSVTNGLSMGEFIAKLRSAVVLDNGSWCDELLHAQADRGAASGAACEEMSLAVVLGNSEAILALSKHGGLSGPYHVKLAIESGRSDSLAALEKAGADLMGVVGAYGQTPLMLAASVGREEVFGWLMRRTDLGAKDAKGLSAFDHVLAAKAFDPAHWVSQWALAEKTKEALEKDVREKARGSRSSLSL